MKLVKEYEKVGGGYENEFGFKNEFKFGMLVVKSEKKKNEEMEE